VAAEHEWLHCPLCGMEFEGSETACAAGCPLGSSCEHVRCPNCGYEQPREPRWVAWLRRVLQHGFRVPRPANGTTMPLERLRGGERGVVQRLSCPDAGRRNTLTVFGLVPGAEVLLVQRHPSYVVRVGETEVGLDAAIAREVIVKLA